METIRRQLEKEIKGATIKDVVVRNAKPLNVSVKKFITAIRGAKIKEVGRRAKLLIFYLSPSAASSSSSLVSSSRKRGSSVLLFHLKMTGRMLLVLRNAQPTKHTHIIFRLSGSRDLFFEDYRKFGFVKLLKADVLEKYLAGQGYGPEPLSANFNYKNFKECLLAYKNKKIKQVLMEQSCVAGIGNIYAAEICFFAGVHPERKISQIKKTELKKIYQGVKKILASAISNRGTSADSYVDAYGKQGTFVPKLKVYGREGEKCLSRRSPNGAKEDVRCGGIIKKEKIGGRGTYWCPGCQR